MKRISGGILAIGLSVLLLKGNATRAADLRQQPKLSEKQVHALSILGKVWGFLKYYHPQVASGQYDWDSVLLAKIPLFITAGDAKTINQLLVQWLSELGPVDTCRNCVNVFPGSWQFRSDTSWLAERDLDPAVINRLHWILRNRYQGPGYYIAYGSSHQVSIINEKGYLTPDFQYPAAAYRLLLLFRYWNIANYFSPYVYLTDTPWPKVMDEFIPLFYEAKDTVDYQLLVMRLLSSLDDGHSVLTMSQPMQRYWGTYAYVPFQCLFIDRKIVVTKFYNDSLCRLAGIKKGDLILAVDGELVTARWKKRYPYLYGASNEDAKLFLFSEDMLFRGKDSVMDLEISAGQGIRHQRMRRYNSTALIFSQPDHDRQAHPPFHLLPQGFMYVDMGQLFRADIDSLKKAADTCKAIILDLRGYPNDTWLPLATWLADKPFTLGELSSPMIDYPGVFRFFQAGPFRGSGTASFQGKVVILVNEATKSHGEFSAMGLQAAVNSTTLGSRTAGADGDITPWILLPGGFRTRFSGRGIYYPDGTPAQRKGVKVDILVRPSIKGLQEDRDEVLDKAIRVLNQ